MELDKFIQHTPYLYHLTSQQNAENIMETKILYSANSLIDMSNNKKDKVLKRNKRFVHQPLIIHGIKIFLRDQRPISEKALSKCLTDNWLIGDFLDHLNNRVFMWPNLGRLTRHYNRYANEKPVLFRFSTSAIINANPHVKFARLNTGATRANSHLGGKAPERGPNTFLKAEDYQLGIRSVAEVTFEKYCNIAGKIGIDFHPEGAFKKSSL